MQAKDLIIGDYYNWVNQSDRLIYIGRKLYPDGYWYQFSKIDSPDICWCEVISSDIPSFEKTIN